MFTFCQVVKKWTFLTTSIHTIGRQHFLIQFCSSICNMKRQYLLWNTNYIQIFNFHFVKSHIGPALVLQIILTSYWGVWCSLWLCKSRDLSKTRRRGPLWTLTCILDLPHQHIFHLHPLRKGYFWAQSDVMRFISMTNPLLLQLSVKPYIALCKLTGQIFSGFLHRLIKR